MTIEEKLGEIVEAKVQPIVAEIVGLRQLIARQARYVSRKDIAEELHRSLSWLRERPWILPGEPDIPGNPELWKRERWEEHRETIAWRLHATKGRKEAAAEPAEGAGPA